MGNSLFRIMAVLLVLASCGEHLIQGTGLQPPGRLATTGDDQSRDDGTKGAAEQAGSGGHSGGTTSGEAEPRSDIVPIDCQVSQAHQFRLAGVRTLGA